MDRGLRFRRMAVQVVDVCVSTRERNGGMIALEELIGRVGRMRGSGSAVISKDDILKTLELLRPLHAGYSVHPVGSSFFVRSVPRELDTDQTLLLVVAADSGGRLTEELVQRKTGWSEVRCRTVLDDCVAREGLGWVDEQGSDRSIWLIAAVDFGDLHA